ncbi:MAG TPA: hypothetical protein VIU15_04770 [Streptomyces sp.]
MDIETADAGELAALREAFGESGAPLGWAAVREFEAGQGVGVWEDGDRDHENPATVIDQVPGRPARLAEPRYGRVRYALAPRRHRPSARAALARHRRRRDAAQRGRVRRLGTAVGRR